MRIIIALILFLLYSISGNSQIRFNEIDSSYTFTYGQLMDIRNNINKTTYEITKLQATINLLEGIDSEKTTIITKLNVRDSLYNKELELYKSMDGILRDKLAKSSEVIVNYKTLLLINGDELKLEINHRKRESMWKNIYKVGYPVLIVAASILIFK